MSRLTSAATVDRINATKKLPGEGFKRPWPPLIKMDAAVKAKVEKLLKLGS
jgi:4-hydroxy-3-polyprenylbenzoate decarboxylase